MQRFGNFAALLGDGGASRFNLNLREKKQSVDDAAAEYFSGKYGGAIVFQALTDQNRLDDFLQQVMAEVQKINLFGVPDWELQKVKNKIQSSKTFEKQNMDGQAKTFGFWELQGDYLLEEKFLKTLAQVSSEDIKRISTKYIRPERASLVIYHPMGQRINTNAIYWQTRLTKGMDSVQTTEFQTNKSTNKIQTICLLNGSKLILKERKNLPINSIGVFLPGGFFLEQSNQYGITALMTKCLQKGTLKKSHEQFSQEIESYAAHLDSFMEKDYWGLTLDVLKPNFNKAFDLLLENLFEPQFSKSEIEKEKKLQLAAINRLKDDPSEFALLESDVATFSRTPYAHSPMGTKKTLSNLTQKDIQQWHQRHLNVSRLTWVAVGDFDPKLLKDLLETQVPNRPQRPVINFPKPLDLSLSPSELNIENEVQQSHIVLGYRAPAFRSPDYFSFRILNTILNGMGGKLFGELREKRSLAYSVFAAHDAVLGGGTYQVYIGCSPSKVTEAKRELIRVLESCARGEITESELKRAKTYMIGLYQMGLQSNRSQVHSFARYELAGLGAQYVEKFPNLIRSIKISEVQKVAKKYLNTQNRTWVILGPKNK